MSYVRNSVRDRFMGEKADIYGTFDQINTTQVENHAFTEYIQANLRRLTDMCHKIPHINHDAVDDLIQDAWLSCFTREQSGRGFNEEFVNKNGEVLSVGNTIVNMLQQMAKNEKYAAQLNNKRDRGTNREHEEISISPCATGASADDADVSEDKQSFVIYQEASLKKSSNTEETAINHQQEVIDDELQSDLYHIIMTTEELSCPFGAVIENYKGLKEYFPLIGFYGRNEAKKSDPDGMSKALHDAMFSDYPDDNESMSTAARLLRAMGEDYDRVYRAYQVVRDSLANDSVEEIRYAGCYSI